MPTTKPPADKPADNPTGADTPTSTPATASPAAPPAAGDVTTPPSGPKPDDAVPGTVAGQGGDRNTRMIDALLDERAGYVAAGRTERVKAVDKQLAAYGTTYQQAMKDRKTRAQHPEWSDPVAAEKSNQRTKMLDALLEEREGYERRGMTDRMKAVDEQFKAYDTTYTKAAKDRAARIERDAAPQQPADARTAQQQTR